MTDNAPATKQNWDKRAAVLSVFITPVILFLIFWLSRLPALTLLPLHNDEGLHLTRAIEVWNLHPFWEIGDGKIINHWLIAAFYPQNSPDFVGRYATVLVGLLGLAAAWKLISHIFGKRAALLASILWIASPYLFFFERLAFSDAQAGAWVITALLSAIYFARTGKLFYAFLAGIGLTLSALFKFTAIPFALSVGVILLLYGRISIRQRLYGIGMVAGVGIAGFSVPILYMLRRGGDFFGIALGWISGDQASGAGFGAGIGGNFARLWSQFTDYGSFIWAGVMLIGLIALVLFQWRKSRVLLLGLALPFAAIMVLGREVLPRHTVVALPYALMLGGAGLALLIEKLTQPKPEVKSLAISAASVILLLSFAPFALTAYQAPETLPLPVTVSDEHITQHSAGYGLREAAQSLASIVEPNTPIIASMFPDSCRRANFYADAGYQMRCTDAPALRNMIAALEENETIYVLVEKGGMIGLDMQSAAQENAWIIEEIAPYPRPQETQANASLILWRVSR